MFAIGLRLPQRRETLTAMHRFFILSGTVLILATVWVAAAQPAAAEPAETAAIAMAAPEAASAEVGIGGIFRVGYWTGIRFPLAAGPPSPNSARTVETLDGDGVRVQFRQATAAGSSRSLTGDHSPWNYAVPGSATAPLRLYTQGDQPHTQGDQPYTQGDQPLWQGRFSGQAIGPAVPWVVVIGDTLGLETIGRSELLGRDASVAVAKIAAAADLPDQAAGWEGVDLLVVNATGTQLLASLDQDRIAAIAHWFTNGGRLLVSLGKEGEAMLSAAPWLAELIELPLQPASIRLDPGELEQYTLSTSRLPTLAGYELPAQGGRTIIAGRTVARQPARLVMERLVGMGRVVITSFAPDSPEMAAWPQRTALIARMHPGLLDVETHRRREARSVAAVAYDDLAGQVRAALDRFESHRRTPFSIVSLILLLLAALVGPLDYWLVNRVFGKPLLGWVSFPLSVLLVSGLILALNGRGDSTAALAAAHDTDAATGLRSNRIEIIDINAASGSPMARAVSLMHVSSPVAARVDIDFEVLPQLSDGSTSGQAAIPQPLTAPYGYPSTTFGGISIAGEDYSLPPYAIELFDHGGALAGGPIGFPLSPAGSKGWITRWSFQPALGETSGLSKRRGSELLTGSVTNPLDVDLLSGVLVYGNWAYLLPTRFRSGQTIESIESLRQKNFRWHLTRREALESSSRLDAWNVQMHDLDRLTEILMFESAAGGRDYTGLSNQLLGGLDLSHVLAHGHAILYGRLPMAMLQTHLPEERPTVSAVRVVLPVAPATLRGR